MRASISVPDTRAFRPFCSKSTWDCRKPPATATGLVNAKPDCSSKRCATAKPTCCASPATYAYRPPPTKPNATCAPPKPKGNRRELLPLPVDVGEAIADYCRNGRRNGGCRTLFLSCVAPWNGLSPSAISQVVARACQRAGLKVIGAHRLRHTAATGMRAAGAPLFEIGQVLRHRHVASTALYAKDDLAALRVVTRRWPGSQR
jgi:integrase